MRERSLRVSRLLPLLLLSLFPAPGFPGTGPAAPSAAPSAELEYIYPDQSVWTTRLDAAGDPLNPQLEFAAALLERAGLSWRGRGYPAARMFARLGEGANQFSILVKSPALAACCLLSRKPVTATELRVYRKAGTPPVRRREDLAGKTVITIRGYSYGGLLDFINEPGNRIFHSATARHESAFAMLAAGRGDYLLDYSGPAAEVLADHPVAGLDSEPLQRLDIHLVLSRRYPDAPAVMERLEAIAETLSAEGMRP